MNDFKLIISLIRKLKPSPWAIPAIIVLGTLSSLCEGLGISLFIPFIKDFGQTNNQIASGNFLLDFINGIFINIPVNSRAIVIPLCILGTVLLKNVLLYANTLLSGWMYLHLAERLISRMFSQLLTVSYSFLETQPSGSYSTLSILKPGRLVVLGELYLTFSLISVQYLFLLLCCC